MLSVAPKPLVEILLSTYDGAAYLEAFLASLTTQTFRDWKVTVRDDGSEDGSIAILRAWGDRHPGKLAFMDGGPPGHVGLVASFSALLMASTADYVMFADQDDVWLPSKIEITFRAMCSAEANASAGRPLLVHTDLTVVDRELRTTAKSLWRFQGLAPGAGRRFARSLVENSVTGCTTMLNRALVEHVGEAPAATIHFDWWVAMVATAFGDVISLDARPILWRRHGANASEISSPVVRSRGALRDIAGVRDRVAMVLEESRPRVAEFRDRYRREVSSAQASAIAAFLGLARKGPLRRRLSLMRHGIYFGSPLRNAALMALVAGDARPSR